VVTGPLNAGLFYNPNYDGTFRPTELFSRGPREAVAGWEQAKQYFNFGTLEVTDDGTLTAAVRGIDGRSVFELPLHPEDASEAR
jgi:hypothetical protein